MASLTRFDDLREAITALDEGRALAVDVERLTEDAIANGVVSPKEALRELRSAVNRNVAAGIITRLQLDVAGAWQRVAPAERGGAVSPSRVTEAPLPVEETVLVAEALDPRRSFLAEKRHSSDGDRRWVDQEPYSARSEEANVIGQVMGNRYRLDRQIGPGVMGMVYLGIDLEAYDTPCAVTVLRPEFRSFSEALALLRTEVRVTRLLRHPHIARVYSLNSERLGVYLVTEYLEGRTLEATLWDVSAGLPLHEARRIVAEVCSALAYAHDLDVVHGDLQPANVFVTLSGQPKVLNFGLARAAGTRNGRFDSRRLGNQSLAFASAEMLEGRKADQRDDVYSLGCVIYSTLSGVHPFEQRTAVEARNLALVVQPLPSLSREQNAALAQALAFQRDQRTPGVIELLVGLGWIADAPANLPAVSVAAPPAASATVPFVAPAAPAAASAAEPAVPAAVRVGAAEDPPPAATDNTLVAVSAPESKNPKSEEPAAADSPPTAVRTGRRGPGRLPLTSIKATPRAQPPPPPPPSRRFLIPVLIVLSLLLVAAGVGIFLYLRHGNTRATTGSHAEVNSPSSPPAAMPSTPAVANAATSASSSSGAAAPQPLNPPTVTESKAAAESRTPAGAALPLVRPLPKAAAAMANSDNCPYPREAMDQGVTGTVLLLVYVTPDGKPAKSKMDRTSGSEVLDQAATRCIEQFARFPAPSDGTPGYWGRVRFKWSVGG